MQLFLSSLYLEGITDFLHGGDYQGNVASKIPTLIGYSKLCLSSNQISGFFDHQYPWKESIDLLDFCMEITIKAR